MPSTVKLATISKTYKRCKLKKILAISVAATKSHIKVKSATTAGKITWIKSRCDNARVVQERKSNQKTCSVNSVPIKRSRSKACADIASSEKSKTER